MNVLKLSLEFISREEISTKVKKSNLLMILFLIQIPIIQGNMQSSPMTNQSNSNYSLSIKVTNLLVYPHAWSFNYYITIKIFNPSKTIFKINQQNSCGFPISINLYTENNGRVNNWQSVCYQQVSKSGLSAFRYKPGTTTELFNGTVSFSFTNGSQTALAPGFYFFDIDTYLTSVQIRNALFVNFENSQTAIRYNESSPDTLPYGSLPISKQLSLFVSAAPFSTSTKPTTSTSLNNNSNITPILKVFNFLFTSATGFIFISGIIIVSVFVFIKYRKKHPSHNPNPNPFRSSVHKPIYLSRSQYNQTQLKENYGNFCIHCRNPINKDDIFCAICGQKIL